MAPETTHDDWEALEIILSSVEGNLLHSERMLDRALRYTASGTSMRKTCLDLRARVVALHRDVCITLSPDKVPADDPRAEVTVAVAELSKPQEKRANE